MTSQTRLLAAALSVPSAAELAAETGPWWLWSADGVRLIATNRPGARAMGAGSAAAAMGRAYGPAHAFAGQIRALADRLPADGAMGAGRLRVYGRFGSESVVAEAWRFSTGEADLVAVRLPGLRRGAPREAAEAFVSDLPVPALLFEAGGAPLAASAGAASIAGIPLGALLGAEAERTSEALAAAGRATVPLVSGALVLVRLNAAGGVAALLDSEAAAVPPEGLRLVVPAGAAPPAGAAGPEIAHDAAAPAGQPDPAAAETPPVASDESSPAPGGLEPPARFSWRLDGSLRFYGIEPAEVAGPAGLSLGEADARFGLDPTRALARAVAAGRPFSGVPAVWPLGSGPRRLAVTLAAFPALREGNVHGYAGFGLVIEEVARAAAASGAGPEAERATGDAPGPATAAPDPAAREAEARPSAPTAGSAPGPAAEPRPALTVHTTPANVVALRTSAGHDPKRPGLSPGERNAFREIARALGARAAPDGAAPQDPRPDPAAAAADPVPEPAADHAPPADDGEREAAMQPDAAPPAAAPAGDAGDRSETAPAEPEAAPAEPEAAPAEAGEGRPAAAEEVGQAESRQSEAGTSAPRQDQDTAQPEPAAPAEPSTPGPGQPAPQEEAAGAPPLAPASAARPAAFVESGTPFGPLPSAFGTEPRPTPGLAPADADIRALVDRVPVGLVVHRGNAVLFANRTLLDWVGFADAAALEAAGGIARLFAGDRGEAGAGEGVVALTAHDGTPVPVEARLSRTSWQGEPAFLFTLRRPEREADGEGEAAAVTLAELRGRLDEVEQILDTATDGIVIVNADGSIESMNRSAEALFGYESAEVKGHSITTLFAPESHRSALDYCDGLLSNGVASVLNDGRQVIGRVKQGGLIPLYMTMGRTGPAARPKLAAVFRDITQWKKAEEDLIAAKRQAEQASSQKSDFLAKISHEIRTPLNAIIGFSEVMMEERFGPVGNERYRDYLKDIHASGGHVLSLINDLLDLSKIEAGKLELSFTSVDLNDIVQSTVAIMQPQANRERVIIRSSLARLPNVVADARSLRQIVLNLLSNSVKFTPAGGQIIVSTALSDAGEAVLRVRDTGVGMTEDELRAAMEPFRQVATSNPRAAKGTGLGLPLTKALVEANRASFGISSAPNQGTLVEVVFPPTRVLAE